MGSFMPFAGASGSGSVALPFSSGTSLPALPTFTSPASGASGNNTGTLPFSSTPPGGGSFTGGNTSSSYQDLPDMNNTAISPFLDPTLTNQLLSMLGGQIGQGLPAFNQSVALPTGGTSTPGSLSAPLNSILQGLMGFETGQTGPGSLPGVLPEWQSEMAAMQQPIQQNLADIREQFGSMGALGSTESAGALSDYLSQTSADEMSLLTQATQASLPTMLQSGMSVQGLNNQAIQNAYNQYQTDLPQNNPLMQDMMALGTMQPGTTAKQPSEWQSFVNGIIGDASGIIGSGVGALDSATGGALPGWLTSLAGV